MAATVSTKFNLPKTTTYIIMPLAFTGKDKRFEGLTHAYQFLLDEIYTANKAIKGYAKLTYDHFVDKFGMSRETVCGGLKRLEELGIIERLGNSRYKIKIKFDTKNYIKIDDYLYKKLWQVNGKEKRFAYSRILTLSFLKRSCSNPKSGGKFISSQSRIGKAIHLPRTTAGDSVRELSAAEVINLRKVDEHYSEACKRGLTVYTVHPELLQVKQCKPEPPPDGLAGIKAIFKQVEETPPAPPWRTQTGEPSRQSEEAEHRAKVFEAQLAADEEYKALKHKLKESRNGFITAIRSGAADEQERNLDEAKQELRIYLEARGAPSDIIPAIIEF